MVKENTLAASVAVQGTIDAHVIRNLLVVIAVTKNRMNFGNMKAPLYVTNACSTIILSITIHL